MNPNSPFTIFPAIDLRAGKVVRLAQGDPSRQTTYGDDPRQQAEQFKAEGAEWLHVINLSGAFNEDAQANLIALESILSVGLKVEFGGGIRDEETVRIPLEMGVERVFLGTAAIKNPELVDWAIEHYGSSHIAGDIGARDGQVMVKGWQESTPLTVLEIGQRLRDQGVEWCVLTDVKRDGVGTGCGCQQRRGVAGEDRFAGGRVGRGFYAGGCPTGKGSRAGRGDYWKGFV